MRSRSRGLEPLAFVERDVELEIAGDLCRAWFLVPEPASEPVCCVVMAHGFGLTRHCGLREIAAGLAEGGHAVVLFDYRRFGDSSGQPRQVVSFRRQREDWVAAIAFARAQPEVDPARVVLWGFSLGAGHALATAADDRGIAAVVAVAPMFDGISSAMAALRAWSPSDFLRIVVRAARDWIGAPLGRSPVTLPLAARPGELGLLTSENVHRDLQTVVPADFDHAIAARIALIFWTYLPGRRLLRFRRPLLLLVLQSDGINPPGPTLRRARQCDSATIVELDCGHLEVLSEPHRRRVLGLTRGFLHERVPSRKVH